MQEEQEVVAPSAASWTVVCLCAQWCRVCQQYAQDFAAVQAAQPQVRWVWVDVEEQEQAMGDWEIETFPTVLLAQGEQLRFMGVLQPQMAVLQRLLAGLQADPQAAPVGVDGDVLALWQRLQPLVQE